MSHPDHDPNAPLPPPVPTPPRGETPIVDAASVEELLRLQDQVPDLVRERYERFIAVLGVEIVGLDTYASRHGDVAAKRLKDRVRELAQPILTVTKAQVLAAIGDGGRFAYPTAEAAVIAAGQLQRAVRQVNLRRGADEETIELRIGVHCGPALVNEDTGRVYGDTIDAVVRLTAKAGARQILISEAVRGHLIGRHLLEPLGTLELQGQSRELALFSVAWDVPAEAGSGNDVPPELDARYVLKARLGSTGRSSVWHAHDVVRDQDVAIKVLHAPQALSAGERERLADEIEAATRLEHPNLVRIEDCSIHSGASGYVVMELIPGGTTLRERLEEGRFSPHVAALILHEVAEAIAAAHAAGMLHRDLRPENVLLSEDGALKVTELGMALDDAQRRSPEGAALAGSPAYLSPEQVRGDPALPASDVFSLGIVLYELLTGQLPFVGASPSTVMFRIVEGRYSPPEGLDPALGGVLRRCLEVDPSARFADAAELRDALRRVLHQRGVSDPGAALATVLVSGEDADREAVEPASGLHGVSAARGPAFWTRTRGGLAAAAVVVILLGIGLLRPGDATDPAALAAAGPEERMEEGLDLSDAPASASAFNDALAADALAAQEEAEEAARLKASRLQEEEEARLRELARFEGELREEAEAEGADDDGATRLASGSSDGSTAPAVATARPQPTETARRTRRRRASAPVAPRTGTVKLSVTGWADIVVNGKSYGRFPQVSSLTLPEGAHTLELLNPHREPYRKRIRVTAGKEVAHRAELVARP